MNTKKRILIFYLLLILTYSGLYFTTGMILFNYEGTWTESTGELWTFQSMTLIEKISYVAWYIPNFPFGLILEKGLINLFAVCFLNPILIGWTVTRVFNRHRDWIISKWIKVNILLTSLTAIGWILFLIY